ncbi:MAG: adenylosuccinate lyase [bacterium]|nr:adenylosuccinate lyase [bacterium]
MIDRYTLPAMRELWSEQNKFQSYLEIELLVCKAWAELGEIPKPDLENIIAKSKFDINRINEIEQKVKHDVIAFVSAVAENVGPSGRYIHLGMTSSDLLDTSLAVRMRQAADLILAELHRLEKVLLDKAKEYKDTVMIGRTHGVHAEPITLGLKFALWLMETKRNIARMTRAKEVISYGKISGAVGTYAHLPTFIEEYVCRELGLQPAEVANQIIQRDRHAEYLTMLALTAALLEKIALEIRHLQRTEVLECEEPFAKGQKGSSAMPHKRNPVTCEQICGLARLVRSNALAAIENIALWHERDISHSSVERVIIPDSTTLVHYMLVKMIDVLTNLVVHKENIAANLNLTYGVIFSQQVLLALTKKGISREQAYQLVQEHAMKAWGEKIEFKSLLLADERVKQYLTAEEISACFDLSKYTQNIDYIYKKAGIN